MFPELDKAYAPQAIEPRWARRWVEERLFEAPARDAAHPDWSLVIPPPNVTGSLHMGHMLEHTLIDMMVRWQRMRGKRVLWLPGTDHAGIATQMVVERSLAAQGQKRQEMGRDAFVEKIWEWKGEKGGRIKEQMIRLGASCDWSRERFTLDEGLSRAVREVFVRLWEEGLIYRGRYIVNWCPRCQTAVSDLEVTHEPVTGKMYTVRYPVVGKPGEFLLVATTRPETILADVAVAVNARDARYTALIGAQVEVPLVGRQVPVIADEIAQPEFGTGAVKITPGHDANDFAAGERHHLEQLTVIDETGHMNAAAGAYAGLDRFAAREQVVADLDAAGLLAKVDDHPMALGRCQRCRTVIEPRISTQWFVRIAPLAEAAVAAVEGGGIRFTPENNAKIYFDWMANIHDWCISRQLWWGHRIPAWYCDACSGSDAVVVAREAPSACPRCGGALRQETDVLDTWFSSGLWPFSTLGWPDADVSDPNSDLARFYPTALLITGFDILFFWVARMIMLGVHFMDAVPFREVYIHALVRDAGKQKMSKTKGNVIDPLIVTEKYGTDAVRFTLASMAAPGTDIALAEERMQGYAAFANKIWNAARFVFLSLNRFPKLKATGSPETLRAQGGDAIDRWIFSRLNAVAAAVNQSLGEYRFDQAADTLYHFFWEEFCDWYVELSKLRLQAEDRETAAANLLAAFEAALRLLHPVMPFLTEELWQALHGRHAPFASIAFAPYPQADAEAADSAAEQEIGELRELISAIRSLRAQWQLAPAVQLDIAIVWRGKTKLAHFEKAVRELAHAELHAVTAIPPVRGLGYLTTPLFDLQPELRGLVDMALERTRLVKQRDTLAQGVENLSRQLASENFRARAPEKVVAEAEQTLAERRRQLAEAEAGLQSLAELAG
ncbi:MAG TPA: valine--tRNA ligase [Terriglobales bacterium]|jgi:valyl-tRNA synthetase